jgi:uncharacterized protein (DUF1810 family)
MEPDKFRLTRFLDAQENSYSTALHELRAGKKRSHWIWYIFPQLKGLGLSSTSEIYGVNGLAEARAYLTNPILRQRLLEATEAMLAHESLDAATILGELDALKFRSCLTLFSLADPAEALFAKALERFFDGERDARTLELLRARGDARLNF